MANATISPIAATQTGPFQANITFDVGVIDFAAATLSVTAVSGNGITGVTFAVLPDHDMDSRTYNVSFELPSNVEGQLRIAISGMVTREGASSPEGVMANDIVVHYDTTENIAVTFGEIDYRDAGIIVLPLTFAENVIAPSKTVFPVTRVSGADVSDMAYYIVGEDADYELIFDVPSDRAGSFSVGAEGYVLKASSGVRDNVVNSQALADRTISYSTIEPRIVDYEIPANYTLGVPLHVLVEYNIPVTGWNLNNVYEIFLFEGAKLGQGTPYKWIGANPPDIHAPVTGELSMDKNFIGTDWKKLTQPLASLPKTAENGFDGDIWHGEEGQYFLIRFDNPQEVGIFNMTPREGRVRGPIS